MRLQAEYHGCRLLLAPLLYFLRAAWRRGRAACGVGGVTKRGKLREGREQMTLLAKRARHAPSLPPLPPHAARRRRTPPPQQQQQQQLAAAAAAAAAAATAAARRHRCQSLVAPCCVCRRALRRAPPRKRNSLSSIAEGDEEVERLDRSMDTRVHDHIWPRAVVRQTHACVHVRKYPVCTWHACVRASMHACRGACSCMCMHAGAHGRARGGGGGGGGGGCGLSRPTVAAGPARWQLPSGQPSGAALLFRRFSDLLD